MMLFVERAIQVWESLRDAEDGTANHGGDSAEIYFHLLMPHLPAHPNCSKGFFGYEREYAEVEASFRSLFHLFERTRRVGRGYKRGTDEERPPEKEVKILIRGNGEDREEWLPVDDYFAKYAGTNIHRYHVKVVVTEGPDYDYENEEIVAAEA